MQRSILFVIVMLANNFNIVSNKIHRIESNTKLPNKIKISTCLHFLHKCCIDNINEASKERNSNLKSNRKYKIQLKILPEVPDLAMVPRFLIKSSFVIPIPLSRIERIFFSLSNLICASSNDSVINFSVTYKKLLECPHYSKSHLAFKYHQVHNFLKFNSLNYYFRIIQMHIITSHIKSWPHQNSSMIIQQRDHTWISSLVSSPSPKISLSVSDKNLILSNAWIVTKRTPDLRDLLIEMASSMREKEKRDSHLKHLRSVLSRRYPCYYTKSW